MVPERFGGQGQDPNCKGDTVDMCIIRRYVYNLYIYICVIMCVCGGFRKYGYPHIIHLNWIFHYKQSILGHHHFRKPHIYLRKPNLLGFGVGPPLCSTNLANKVGDHLVERMD